MADGVVEAQEKSIAKSAKDDVRALLDRLPDGLTLEQIQYHLGVYVVMTRRADHEDVGCVSHEEFQRRFAKWLDE